MYLNKMLMFQMMLYFKSTFLNNAINSVLKLENTPKNIVIYNYGYSGTGKTYTLTGNDSTHGLINWIIDRYKSLQITLKATSIYGHKIGENDHGGIFEKHEVKILINNDENLKSKVNFLQNLSNNYGTVLQLKKNNIEHYNIIKTGNEKTIISKLNGITKTDRGKPSYKFFKSSMNNPNSSRGHIKYEIELKNNAISTYSRKITIFDLAGSEDSIEILKYMCSAHGINCQNIKTKDINVVIDTKVPTKSQNANINLKDNITSQLKQIFTNLQSNDLNSNIVKDVLRKDDTELDKIYKNNKFNKRHTLYGYEINISYKLKLHNNHFYTYDHEISFSNNKHNEDQALLLSLYVIKKSEGFLNGKDIKITFDEPNIDLIKESEFINESIEILQKSLEEFSKNGKNTDELDKDMDFFFGHSLKNINKVFVIGYVRDEGLNKSTSQSTDKYNNKLKNYINNIDTFYEGTKRTMTFLNKIRPDILISSTNKSGGMMTNNNKTRHLKYKDSEHGTTWKPPVKAIAPNDLAINQVVGNMALSQANQLSERAFETVAGPLMDGGGMFDQTTLDTDRALFIATTFVFAVVMVQISKYMVQRGYLVSNKTAVGFNILLFSTMTMAYTSFLGMESIGPFYVVIYLMMFAAINLGLRVYFDLESKGSAVVQKLGGMGVNADRLLASSTNPPINPSKKNEKGNVEDEASSEATSKNTSNNNALTLFPGGTSIDLSMSVGTPGDDKNIEKITLLTWCITSVVAILL